MLRLEFYLKRFHHATDCWIEYENKMFYADVWMLVTVAEYTIFIIYTDFLSLNNK